MDNLNFTEEDFSKLTLEEIKKFNINKIKVGGRFLIFYLIGENQMEILKNLIDELDLNIKDNIFEFTPLIEVCYQNNFEMATLLVERFKVLETLNYNVNFKSKYGHNPLMLACCNENFKMIKLLLDNGAIPKVDEKGNYECLKRISEKEKLRDFIFKIQSQNIKKVK